MQRPARRLLLAGVAEHALPSPSAAQVEVKRAQRDFQTTEVLGLSLREQLASRSAELAQLTQRHGAVQAELAAASTQLLDSQTALADLQKRHTSLQAGSTERTARLEAALAADRAALADAQGQLAAAEARCAALDQSLQQSTASEAALTAQLKQLGQAHEEQSGRLRQEADARRDADDELAAVRAGLQVRLLGCWGGAEAAG